MNFKEVIRSDNVNFTGIESSYFLLGLLSAFENRFQAMANSTMKEISWKQFFVIICINLCKKAPTVKELSEIMGSSHQNVKQILLKLEKKGFVSISVDEQDKRKQRIELTPYCQEFCEKNDEMSMNLLREMHFKDALSNIPSFYCRGAWDEEKMKFTDRTLCKMLQKAVAKQNPDEYEPWQKALMCAVGKKCDWTDKSYLEPLLKYIEEF